MSDTTVLGRPVTGDVCRYSSREVEQWEDEKFLHYLDAVLNCEGVEGVRWNQYVPGFNDGDPCVFTLGEIYVRLEGCDEDAGEYEDGFVDCGDMWDYAEPGNWRSHRVARPGCEQLYPAFSALEDAFPHFKYFIQASFGDNATVTATKVGFEVEYYDCGY